MTTTALPVSVGGRAVQNGRPQRGRAPQRRMTEQEFADWCTTDTWAEWVDGEVIVMSPVNIEHGQLFSFLHALLRGFVDDRGLGDVLAEPVQIRIEKLRSRRAPDILFLSNARSHQIRETYIDGAPDLILEITSPESQSRDRRDKFLEYEEAGVREYWIVDPLSKTVEAYAAVKGRYRPIKVIEGKVPSKVLAGFFIRPEWLWRKRLPKVSELLKQMSSSRG
jgi:Uma2 family endonuclease